MVQIDSALGFVLVAFFFAVLNTTWFSCPRWMKYQMSQRPMRVGRKRRFKRSKFWFLLCVNQLTWALFLNRRIFQTRATLLSALVLVFKVGLDASRCSAGIAKSANGRILRIQQRARSTCPGACVPIALRAVGFHCRRSWRSIGGPAQFCDSPLAAIFLPSLPFLLLLLPRPDAARSPEVGDARARRDPRPGQRDGVVRAPEQLRKMIKLGREHARGVVDFGEAADPLVRIF